MKRNILYGLIALVFVVSSCKKDYDTDYKSFGADLTLTSAFTSMDDVLKINATVFGTDEPIVVTHLGGLLSNGVTPLAANQYTADLGTITLDEDGLGTILIPDTQLGPNVIGTAFNLKFTIKKGGAETYKFLTVKITDPLTIGNPYTIVNAKKVPTTAIEDAATYLVDYSFVPKNTTVSSVTVESKKGKNGTYAAVAGTWGATGSVSFKGNDYVKYDTVYFRFTGVAGRTVVREKTVVIKVNSYKTVTTVKLEPTDSTAIYDFQENRFIKDADEVAMADSVDIKYLRTDIMGNYNVGFEAPQNAEFVKATGTAAAITKLYTEADQVRTPAIDFSAAVQTIDNPAVGDVYIFRTNRGVVAPTYGFLKITAISKPEANPTKSSFTFELKN